MISPLSKSYLLTVSVLPRESEQHQIGSSVCVCELYYMHRYCLVAYIIMSMYCITSVLTAVAQESDVDVVPNRKEPQGVAKQA